MANNCAMINYQRLEVNRVNLIKLNLEDNRMMEKLYTLYLEYEAEISNASINEIFDQTKPIENYQYFQTYFSRGINTYILCEENSYVGFVSGHIDSSANEGYAKGYHGYGHLAEIYIDKEYRGKSYGKKLVLMIESLFIKTGIHQVYLCDIVGNHDFWLRLGYVDTKVDEPTEGGRIFVKKLESR